jgi:hypothetical protein
MQILDSDSLGLHPDLSTYYLSLLSYNPLDLSDGDNGSTCFSW